MANDALWTKTSYSRSPIAPVQLLDGTEITFQETTSGTYLLMYSIDHATPVTIATFSGYTAGNIISVCVDLFGNIYITMQDSGHFGDIGLHAQAFLKGTGYSWTPKGWMLGANPQPAYGMASPSICWSNTSGGLNAAGHILAAVRSYLGGSYGDSIVTIDAGVLLAGSGIPYVGVAVAAFGGSGGSIYHSLSTDGFGAIDGIVVFPGVPADHLYSWTVNGSGLVTFSSAIGALISTLNMATGVSPQLVWIGTGLWAMTYDRGTSPTGPTVLPVTLTGFGTASTVGTPTGWGGLAQGQWSAFASATTPGRIYLIGYNNAAFGAGVVYHLGCNVNALTATFDAAVVVDDNAFGTSAAAGQVVGIFVVCAQPFVTVVDYIAVTTDSPGLTTYTMNGSVVYPDGGSPNSPALLSPSNNAYVDQTSGVALSWAYNSGDGPSQAAYAIRFKIAGTPTYRYWNVAGGVSSSTVVWNIGAAQTFTLPFGAMFYGRIYSWSVATKSNTGIQSSFAGDNLLFATAPPIVSLNNLGTVTATSFPTLVWATTTGPGQVQTSWRVYLYSQAQATISGFVPGVSPSTYDSGVVLGAGNSVTLPIPLPNNGIWYPYILVTETGGLASQLLLQPLFFTIYLAPATPALSASPSTDPVTGAPRISLSCQTKDNLYSANDSSFETSVGGWTNASNATLLRSNTIALDGSWSLRLTAIAAGNMSARGPSVAALPLTTYSTLASARTAATSRTTNTALVFEDASHATLSTVTSPGVADTSFGWNQPAISAQSPAGTAFVHELTTIVGCVLGEQHFIDQAGVFLGTTTAWTINNGGYTVNFSYSDDQINWFPVRNSSLVAQSGAGIAAASDYESPPTRNRYYRAQTISGGALGIVSPASPVVFAATNPGTDWWWKDPLDVTTALAFNQDFNTTVSSFIVGKETAHTLLGRSRPVLVSDGMLGEDGTATVVTDGDAAYKTLLSLIKRPARTLLLQSPFGYQWYVSLNGARNIGLMGWTLGRPIRTTQLPYTEVNMP